MYLTNLSNTTKVKVARASSYQRTSKRGFTIAEILVVLAIIGILLSVGVAAIKGIANSKGVSTAVPIAEGVFTQARQVAKATGIPTRVVIYSDTGGLDSIQRDRYLRMIGVATLRDTGQWELISAPTTIPEGAYFNESLSLHSGTGSAIFPGNSESKSCFVYEFNPKGAMIDDSSGDATDGRFVIQAGKFTPPSNVTEDINAKRDIGGFVVFGSGRIATYQSPNQIVENGVDPEF